MSSARKIGWSILAHHEILNEQGIMQESEDQKFPLGTLIHLADGRKFRYCKNGAVALAAGKLLQNVIVATERDDAINAAAAVSAGSSSFLFTAVGTVTKNQFADGFAHIVNDTGEGLQYKIKSNSAAGAGDDFTVNLYDPVVTALAATTDVVLSSSMYSGLLLANGDLAFIIGVATVPITALYYFWAQSGGPGMVLFNGQTGVIATERVLHTDVEGGIDGAVVGTAGGIGGTQIIGDMFFDTTDAENGEYWPIMFSID